MRLLILSGGLPSSAALASEGLTVVRHGPADLALARGWDALPMLAGIDAPRRVLLVDSLEGAPDLVPEPIVLVASGRELAAALPGDPPVLRPARRGPVPAEDPEPLTRGELRDEVVVGPRGAQEVVDAFAHGRTVVARDSPALRDVVTDGHDGLLVAGDAPLRRAAGRLDEDRVLLHHLRCNARRTAMGFPTIEQQAPLLGAVLRRIADGPEPGPPGPLTAAHSAAAPRRAPWRAALVAAALVGVLAALLFVPFLNEEREVIAGTPQPAPLFEAAPILVLSGQEVCTWPVPLRQETDVARVLFARNDDDETRFVMTLVGAGGYRARRAFDAPADGAALDLPLPDPPRPMSGVLCVRNEHPRPGYVAGATEGRSRGRLTTRVPPGQPEAELVLTLLEREPASIADRLDEVGDHAATLKPSFAPEWLLWALAGLVALGVPAVAVVAVRRAYA